MDRRQFILSFISGIAVMAVTSILGIKTTVAATVEKLVKSNDEWKAILTPAQYNVLRDEGTEHPFTSPLLDEHHIGTFVCVACDLPLFSSKAKFDSGTGWPSFFMSIPDSLETKSDYKAIMRRTEYHCMRCGGHHGHVFNDGPQPTGLRYCSNGVALKFIPQGI